MSRKSPPSPRATTALDASIARHIRTIRTEKQVTQMALAEAVGVTFQQVQKYERGVNRVSASRLKLIADALAVPIQNFYA